MNCVLRICDIYISQSILPPPHARSCFGHAQDDVYEFPCPWCISKHAQASHVEAGVRGQVECPRSIAVANYHGKPVELTSLSVCVLGVRSSSERVTNAESFATLVDGS